MWQAPSTEKRCSGKPSGAQLDQCMQIRWRVACQEWARTVRGPSITILMRAPPMTTSLTSHRGVEETACTRITQTLTSRRCYKRKPTHSASKPWCVEETDTSLLLRFQYQASPDGDALRTKAALASILAPPPRIHLNFNSSTPTTFTSKTPFCN